MATQTLSLPSYISGDADFRTWGKGISDALAAIGLVKAGDTGQIDWTTVIRPSVNLYAGYEIWRFADPLQATLPVFVKLEYGITNAVDRPALAVTVGTATNGAGAINAQTGNRSQLIVGASAAVGEKRNTYVSGSSRSLAFVTNHDPSSASYGMGVLVGRPVDGAGNPTAEGIVTYTLRSSSTQYQVIPAAGSLPSSGGGLPVPPTTGGRSSVGVDIALGVPVVLLGKVRYSDLVVTYEHADIGELVPFQANNFGAAHTYLPLGDGVGTNHGSGTAVTIALLWE